MPKITRKQQKIFASNASNTGVFGSLQANDPTYSQDPDVIQGRTAYANGWTDATFSAELLPPLEEFQGLQYLFSRQLSYLFQEGVAEWNSATTYYEGSIVKEIDSGVTRMYLSLTDDNTNNVLSDTSNWQCFFDSTSLYANNSFNNITSTAKNISTWSTNATNCITEIPQDINLTLNAGTLTLKAGSKVYVPNGSSGFKTQTITSDISVTITNNATYLVCVQDGSNAFDYVDISKAYSGSTNPQVQFSFWYDTTNNYVKLFRENTSTPARTESLPICIVTVANGSIKSIDRVFNGFGYIGSVAFALPGVKCLFPNGRNADGTLNNIERTTPGVFTADMSNRGAMDILFFDSGMSRIDWWDEGSVFVDYYPTPATGYWYLVYSTQDNVFYASNNGGAYSVVSFCFIGKARNVFQGKINYFAPHKAFRAVDHSEVTDLLNLMYPLGSIYLGTQNVCPMKVLIPGSTWELVSQNRALWGGDGTNGNTTIAAGLPNITGSFATGGEYGFDAFNTADGCFSLGNTSNTYSANTSTHSTPTGKKLDIIIDASRVSTIYGNSSTVQPSAYRVNVWRRTA